MHGPLEAGATILGGIRLKAPLDGQHPRVWAADDAEGRPVVVKWLPATERAFAEQEVAALERLPPHPGVVALRAHGALGEGWAVVTTWAPGRALTERFQEGLAVDDGLAALARAAEGLAHLHAHGVVHRDAKAANLRVDGTTVTWVDLGLAAVAGGHAQGQGSGHTMAPEQVQGAACTGATDVYALGVLLYRLLAGRYPFHARNPAELAALHLHAEVPPLPATVPPPLAALVGAMLVKDPAARPSAREVAALLALAPPDARPTPAVVPWLVAGAVVAVGLLLLAYSSM